MNTIPYKLLRSSRKTLSLQITPSGEILLRCPLKYPVKEAEKFLESKRPWLEKHLSQLEKRPRIPAMAQEQLHRLAQQAAAVIPDRVAHFAPLLGVTHGRITIRSQRTRWGSCSTQGNLNFNCLLMLCPPEVVDYVVVHELCHRKQMNHSPAFWAEVEALLPDYRIRKQWLKENGGALIAALPDRSFPSLQNPGSVV